MPGYIGSGSINGMYLGASELSAAYIGDVQIYPTTITGLTITSSITARKSGGTFNITVRSESAFNIVADNWITLSAASGDSGTTRITVTIGANETGNDRTGGITATTTDNVYSAACSVYQDNLSIVYVSYVYAPNENRDLSSRTDFTTYIVTTGTSMYLDGYVRMTSSGGFWWGARGETGGDQDDYRFFDLGGTTIYFDFKNNRLQGGTTNVIGKECHWKIGNFYYSLDGGVTNHVTGATQTSIGSNKYASVQTGCLKVNRWRILENDVLQYDFRAAIDPGNNNKAGLYDEASDTWLFNNGDNLTYDP